MSVVVSVYRRPIVIKVKPTILVSFNKNETLASKAYERIKSIHGYDFGIDEYINGDSRVLTTTKLSVKERMEFRDRFKEELGKLKQEEAYQTILNNAQKQGINLRQENFDDENIVLTYTID